MILRVVYFKFDKGIVDVISAFIAINGPSVRGGGGCARADSSSNYNALGVAISDAQ